MDENKEAAKEECDHLWKSLYEEFGGLAGGGDYERYECQRCKKRIWVEIPD